MAAGALKQDAVAEHSLLPGSTGAAVVCVEREDGRVRSCNRAAESLLGAAEAALKDRPWHEVFGVVLPEHTVLGRAIRDGTRTALPPTLLHPAPVGEIVVGGYLFPESAQATEVFVLLLFQLGSAQDFLSSRPPGPTDVVAVLGLEGAESGVGGASAEIARRMVDIRFGLQQIVPAREDVGIPVGSTIPVALRDVTLEQAQDISRALLSHLAPLLAEGTRIRVGLAQCGAGESGLAALIAANNALLRLQRTATAELIAQAGAGDDRLPGASAAAAEGIFSDGGAGGRAARAYLEALVAMDADPQHSSDYLFAVMALTLRQDGLAAAAIYRRRHDDSYEYVAGGLPADPLPATEKGLPRPLRQAARRIATEQLRGAEVLAGGRSSCAIFPLRLYDHVLGFMVLQYREDAACRFVPEVAALHHLATELSALNDWRQAGLGRPRAQPAAPRPPEERIDGYVGDNMEGAIDQAVFLARLDVPVAVIGPRGTGKLYVAKVIHQESGGTPERLVTIDCREFRGRKDALNRIARELQRSSGKTLVFKSPQLMHPEAQLKLARQLSTRVLADTSPPRYLPAARIIGLFPDSLEELVRRGGLNDRLASVFAAYPIRVPPIKDRKRAVLRWAYKILAQEAERRDRRITGFTPDAEQALLQHDWPGNISEMRQCIVDALARSDKEWLTPVDLGIFKGLSPGGRRAAPEKRAYLQILVEELPEETAYAPTTLEELAVALGEALHNLLEMDMIKPLGEWLDDEIILAACERYRDNMRAAADFLQTRPRNIARWLPAVQAREQERAASALWQTPQRLIRQWVRETAPGADPPQQQLQGILLAHVVQQCGGISVSDRASIMGVSTPTYNKRLQDAAGG